MTYAVLLWALTIRTLINGDFETVIIEMHNTEKECMDSKYAQSIFGECQFAEAVGSVDAV